MADAHTILNSKIEINKRVVNGQIKWYGPVLMVFARPLLALLSQGLVISLFIALKRSSDAYPVTAWWTVYSTLVDIGCLLFLFFLLKREGIKLFDLVSFDRSKLSTDLLIGLGILVIIFPLTIGIGSNLASILVYGSLKPDLPPGSFIRILPLWAVLYSRLIWWIIWSATEELTYNAYALPRLQILTGKTWIAVLGVGFGWALQHSFLPFINVNHAIWLLITFFPLTIAIQLVYLKYRRLFPLIIGHWAMDFFSVVFMLKVG